MVAEIKELNNQYVEDARKVLSEALEQGFIHVTIIGQTPNGQVHIKGSNTTNLPKLLGAVEVAKLHLYSTWGKK